MRFENIQEFSVDDLLLDEGNYRFRKASDQQACIEKIYSSNPVYFSNLMGSIAEDDLGELLLVYLHDDEAIVLDGNRRTAAIKVLWNPDLAPTPSLKKKAERLASSTKFDFERIQAQVSKHQDKIYQTVYERHASGNGSRRLSWSAIAAARFRLDQKILDDNTNWHATALIFALEAKNSEISDFIDSKDYSHEVFTRVVRAAISRRIISKSIFSDKDMRIKKQPKKLIQVALKMAQVFVDAIQSRELSLSRKGDSYADANKIDQFLSPYEKPADDNGDLSSIDEYDTVSADEVSNDKGNSEAIKGTQGNPSSNEPSVDNSDEETSPKLKPSSKIEKSAEITRALSKLESSKMGQLYSSLCGIPLRPHASLMCVGAWTFLEVLATLAGKKADVALEGFYQSKINEWFKDKGEKAELRSSIKYLVEEGNVIKHGGTAHSPDARHLSIHFKILEPLLLEMIALAVKKKLTRV